MVTKNPTTTTTTTVSPITTATATAAAIATFDYFQVSSLNDNNIRNLEQKTIGTRHLLHLLDPGTGTCLFYRGVTGQ